MKAFPTYSREQVRNELSYANLMMMLLTIPPYRSYNSKNKSKGQKQKKSQIEKPKHWELFGF